MLLSPDVSSALSTSMYGVALEMEMRFVLMPSLELPGTDLAWKNSFSRYLTDATGQVHWRDVIGGFPENLAKPPGRLRLLGADAASLVPFASVSMVEYSH
jgi:hypothetical protein